jgi:hypothetical protein
VRRLCLLVVLGAFVGCGSTRPTQLSELVARASKLCPEAQAGSYGRAESTNPTAIREVKALVRANENLAVVHTFETYTRERRMLRASEGAAIAREGQAASVVSAQAKDRQHEWFQHEVAIYRAERRLPGIGACAVSPFSNL